MKQRIALAMVLLLSACGQKGALYLPDAQPKAVPAQAQPAAPDDSSRDRKPKAPAGT
ncbi:MAG: Prokaryotic lipoprotein-attachment site [Pseudomonadota bacterium]|jgi:predicted small lipoprotein YifL